MRRLHSTFAISSLLLFAAAAAWPGPAPAQDTDAAQWEAMSRRFDGVWRLTVSSERGQQTIDSAVEEAVGAMNFMMRGIARPMLRDNTPLNQEIELRFRDNDNIYVRFDSRVRYTSPLGSTRRVRTHEGDPMRLTQRFRGDDLEQVFQADGGTRWNTYTILPDGRMQMTAVTQGDMMPRALRFTLTYRRQ